MKDRNELIEEQLLREVVRKAIRLAKKQKLNEQKQDENILRQVVRKLISEKVAVADDTPHQKTGINKLRKTLKKIIPTYRDEYLSLTTNKEQREAYVSFLVNGLKNLLSAIETNIDAPEPSGNMDEVVDVQIGDDEEEDKFIDIGDMGVMDPEPEPEEIDDDEQLLGTGMEDQEQSEDVQTGRNAALSVLKQIRGTVVSDFSELANDEDRELYYDYLITNMLLWRDEFEDFLGKGLETPTTPEYEKEKDAKGIGPSDEGGEEEDLLEIIDL